MYPHKSVLEHNTLQRNREQLSLTQAHIAGLLSLSDDAIGNYENGRRAPRLHVALVLELILGRGLAELYPGLARAMAEHMIPQLQRLSVKAEWGEDTAKEHVQRAIAVIGERLSHLVPLA